MAVMVGVVGALSAFYHDSLDITNPEHREISAMRLIAKVPTIAAMCYKYNIGQPFMYPKNALGFADNFLYMRLASPADGNSSMRGVGRTGGRARPTRRAESVGVGVERGADQRGLDVHLRGARRPWRSREIVDVEPDPD